MEYRDHNSYSTQLPRNTTVLLLVFRKRTALYRQNLELWVLDFQQHIQMKY
jgi:hypothetical protein